MVLLAHSVNICEAVHDCYGVRIPLPPEDWRCRNFPIDKFRFGFVISAPGVKVFGCHSDGDIYYFDGEQWDGFKSEVRRPEKYRFDRTIIACAKALIERGEILSAKDEVRLKVAVQQVEISS